ncbi:tRNA uridine-5-carboxymethylaminomethyl(34) synthesis GTPase MnmE [Rhodocaloribacter litoris]|uniref:tRNA uridine-5-carboxymethylaminomethyl(34) synthesis GTPase MnmE n=1 Tax=Rhodocaloribacter litoris TaxID=2558931 RepID=UPI0014232FFD|nr:tRNA uridine-5-carboxymethylaminomethyl(34) synthesis GTPase MnmE [Rhodocaloribacter litoris]QXD13725.1 tRNA uridine-5-carboxymethylaminomethyl(34) synthesis GTPase MnmE [Rhodocaloribacter litoris]GIV61032.1 MAG: tRNA modification GTPase MnmE [Rhodothermaceae bacterium]
MRHAEDTIAALATARGRAALAVLRVSGPEAVSVVNACFRGKDLTAVPSHTAHVGYLLAPDGAEIDQVVVTVFRAPHSATGEDVVEVSCHGGDFAPQLILESLLAHGARMAAPGEFTQRAFLNGKLDLAQAEAVADLIHAGSTLAHRVSLAHLQGRYSAGLARLREELLELCAYVELELDFAEEDVEFADRERLLHLLDESEATLSGLLDSYRLGVLLRDGVTVVIGGRPNAGKSTLLNALVGRERAIVSDVPGTTRDEIEAEAEIRGLRFRFVDTAGLRQTADAIEAEGVRRARRSIEAGDVLVYVYDLTRGLDAEEAAFLREIRHTRPALRVLVVGNKRDLVPGRIGPPEGLDGTFLPLSARDATSDAAALAPLVDALVAAVGDDLSRADASPVVMNQRHRAHLRRALDAVRAARRAFDAGASGDTLALDLRTALHELGAITGAVTTEDVLDQIFSRFCIGK